MSRFVNYADSRKIGLDYLFFGFKFYVNEIHSTMSYDTRSGGQTMLRKTLDNLCLSRPYLIVTSMAQHHVTLQPPSHCRWLLGHSIFRDALTYSTES